MKHLIIGTAGHIDHGKTSLIKALTNIDCDTHKEEKLRGITINLGFSYLDLPNGESVGIIDVPGHKDFINTMVGGACGIDMVLLVIAADSGMMPQTIEHINIITALGIKKGVVALTKIDAVDEELAEMAKYEISDYLDKTSLKDIPIIGVSSVTKVGLDELTKEIEKCIDEIEERETQNLFRMYIDRIFTVKGFGSVVTGSVLGGEIAVGQDVFLLPGNFQKLRVRSIERHGKNVEKAIVGDRAAINLIGLKNEDFERGMLLCNKKIESTSLIDAQIKLFDIGFPLELWTSITIISGTYECQGRMHLLDKEKLQSGEIGTVQIHLNKPAVMMCKDKFIIRNSSADLTLGGGFVLDPAPLHHKRRTPKLSEYLNELSKNIISEQSTLEIIRMELKKEFRPYTFNEVLEKLNLKPDELRQELNTQNDSISYYKNNEGEILVEAQYNTLFKERITKFIQEHHTKNSLFPGGLEINELSGKFNFSKLKHAKMYLEMVLEEMKNDHVLDMYKSTWIIKGHKAILDKQSAEEKDYIEQLILNYGDEKPAIVEIEEQTVLKKINTGKFKTLLALLTQEGKIRYFQNDFIHSEILDRYRNLLLSKIIDKENGVELPEYKEILGGTKKFRALITDIFEAERIIQIKKISDNETRFCITELGKKAVRG
ncbi:MAG: selenocysteine-specific translation elongation factor [Bacteroidales bacterium]|nr:selenocysteine-specific translation elongation factor [Bacteroidales bacterium]